MSGTLNLQHLLQQKFGFQDFRLSQQTVCEAVTSGQDVLLVMPTGAGKSLCYQLPGIARGGTTLVISPLLALIDDQVGKLQSRGFRAQAIHSGIPRDRAREVCRDYLRGVLDFLFIAPERLAVPGFPEMLQKRAPALIAIDEAHCISQWGHDFRPEYRKLGERLAGLRPAPMIALTATATPLVQDDIVQQLGIPNVERFIQGFRRDNIAISVHEVSRGSRAEVCIRLLSEPGRTPAIVYAPTRKMADDLAEALKEKFQAERYHAGMNSEAREKTQKRFLEGKCDVIVATIAFGMGIDKADVRTVVHAGMPSSVEGYYQEIGRAGRDGKPSAAILLHHFADQRTHEFFFERDYPEGRDLQRIFDQLKSSPIPKDWLRDRVSDLDPEVFDKALEKLWTQGGALIDPEENVVRGQNSWARAYAQQRDHKQQALRQMLQFSDHTGCRMLFFLEHFGDYADLKGECGICDRCTRGQSATGFAATRAVTSEERIRLLRMLASLSESGTKAAGKLFEELTRHEPRLDRGDFEKLIKAMVQAGWVRIKDETFEKDGKKIAYRKVMVTREGSAATREDLAALEIQESSFATLKSKSSKSKSVRKRKADPAARIASHSPEAESASEESFDKLRTWRLGLAREQGVPAFRILSDRVLKAVVEARPANLDELQEIHGLGPKLCEKYGKSLLRCLSP